MGKKPLKPPAAVRAKAPAAAVASTREPKPSASSAQPESPSPRGRVGAPKATPPETPAKHPESRPAAAHDGPVADIELGLVCPLFDNTAENTIGLQQASLRKLGVTVGDLCTVRGLQSGVSLVLAAAKVTSKDVHSGKATINARTLQLLEGRDVVVAPYDGPSPVEVVSELGPLVLHRLETASDASEAAKECRLDARQLEAAFHGRFCDQVVFDRMVCQVNLAGFTIVLRLELPPGLDVARLTPMARYAVVPLRGAEVHEADEDEDEGRQAGESAAADVLKLEVHVGPPGTGKSFALRNAVSDRAQRVTAVELRVEEVLTAAPAAGVSMVRAIFERAGAQTPACIVVDDAHVAFGSAAMTDEARWKKRLLARALASAVAAAPSGVRCFLAAPTVDVLDPMLVRGTHARIVQHGPPSSAVARVGVLREILRREQAAGTPVDVPDDVLDDIGAHTVGFVQADLASAVALAKTLSFEQTCKFSVNETVIRAAVRRTRPTAIRNIDVAIPTVKWDDIGGSSEGKHVLQEYVRWSLGEQRQLFAKLGVSPPRGVLLYGPPGCSKTMLAKALAHESQLNFIAVKGPEVFSKWVGDSEKAVREIFFKARSVAPCVVFVDELDGMCGHRGAAGGGGVADRVISQFLTELDGLPAAVAGKPDDVVFVAATNRPDNIDPAVLRPGRIDRFVYVGLPQRDERVAIAGIGFRGVPVGDGVTAEAVANQTEGYTGAEVIAVCKEAAYQCVAENEDADVVEHRHLEAALARTKPRVSAQDIAWYKTWGEQTRR